jgi:hypothetical protein
MIKKDECKQQHGEQHKSFEGSFGKPFTVWTCIINV